MRRDFEASRGIPEGRLPATIQKAFEHPDIAAVFGFGSTAEGKAHGLSDVDLAFLGMTGETEDQVFDAVYEALQRELGEGRFDLVPLHRAPLHLQFAIATEGRLLLARDPAAAESFCARAISRYLDFKPCRDRYFATTR